MSETQSTINNDPDVSVVIVSYNTAHLVDRLFACLNASKGSLRLQVIVVDNASRDDSVDVLRRCCPDAVLIVNEKNIGFGRANNQAVPLIRGRYVLLLNTDAFVSSDTLTKTVDYLDRNPACGVLGVRLLGENRDPQPSCRSFPTPWNIFLQSTGLKHFFPGARLIDDPKRPREVEQECDWVPGCYYLIRREVIDRVGLFDPRFFLYYEEVDHCRAVKAAGWSVIYYPHSEVIHIGGESAESESVLAKSTRQISTLQIESELLYFRKHYGILGVLLSTLLGLLADVILGAKTLIKWRGRYNSAAAYHNSVQLLTVLSRTRFGSRPTR